MEEKVIEILKSKGALYSTEIANLLDIDHGECSPVLNKMKNANIIWQDRSYLWHLDTPLSRLCKYYLQCISLDDENGVSLLANSIEYVEISTFPNLTSDNTSIFANLGTTEFFNRLRNSPSKVVPVVGFPIRLRLERNRYGLTSYKIEPVLLFEFAGNALQLETTPSLVLDPILNTQVIKNFSVGEATYVMDEIAHLSEELGIGNGQEHELFEIVTRLREIRNNWDWAENINPHILTDTPSLGNIQTEGIYNRAVVFGMEKSVFTKGLEKELTELSNISENIYANTALGQWLSNTIAEHDANSNSQHLLEPLPLNSEQNEAVQRSLTQPLTVITGPPGTGKSQVVSTILINAAKAGKKVLFASKNHKAIDVVETRVNSLGSRPALLRFGRNEDKAVLANYLTDLLASHCTNEDIARYNNSEEEYGKILSKISELNIESRKIIELRNTTDELEKICEPVREDLGKELFTFFRTLDATDYVEFFRKIKEAVKYVDYRYQPFYIKIFWKFIRSRRFSKFYQKVKNNQSFFGNLGLLFPSEPKIDADIIKWEIILSSIKNRIQCLKKVNEYNCALLSLQSSRRIETVYLQLFCEQKNLADKAQDLWSSWLQITPSRLNQEQRTLLHEFVVILQLMADGVRNGGVVNRYMQIFPDVVNLLPSWAITSLSARGRIPLEPGFFDILVIDEASQCDIASAIPLLFRAKSVVIIGDPKQLKHISSISSIRDSLLLEQNGMTNRHLNWSYTINSLYDLASSLTKEENIIDLLDHYRSHADIIGFSNEYFYYDKKLRIATKYDNLRTPTFREIGASVRWYDVSGMVIRPDTGGALNEIEAQKVVQILASLLAQNYSGTVGVVSPFRAQVNRIRKLVLAHVDGNIMSTNLKLLVDTVHLFQGDEKDVILFSPVLSQGMPNSASDFLNKTSNLFNVAVTRARSALIIVGDKNAAKNSTITHFSKFADYVSNLEQTTPEIPESELQDFGDTYPSVRHPEEVSYWERYFYEELYKNGIESLPQYSIDKYRLDFALFSGSRKLNIEIDGEQYHKSWTGELLYTDQLRNRRLTELGWDVMRFWVYEIRDDLDNCIQRVKKWM